MEKQNKKLFFQIALIMAVVATVIASVFLAYYMSKQLFLERSFLLKEISEKSARLVDNVVDSSWDEADFLKKFIEHRGINSTDELLEVMEQLNKDLMDNNAHLIAFDDAGRMYSAKKMHTDVIFDEEIYQNDKISIVELPYDEKDEYIIFAKELSIKMNINNTGDSITHIAMALNHKVMEELFDVSVFSNNCYIYIIDENEDEIYVHTSENDFVKGEKVLDVIKKQVFLNGGSYAELERAIRNKELACVEFDTEGVSYYIAAAPVLEEDWTLLMYVPTTVLSEHTTSVVTALSLYFCVVAILGIIITLFLSTYIVNNINQKEIMEQKEKNSRLLMEMAKEASSANIAKSNFISHMSHDIRTPINGIIGMTNIAKTHSDDPVRVKECLDKISGSSNHLLSLINDVLDMSRIESGKVIILNEPFNIDELIDNCVSIIEGQTDELELNLEVSKTEFTHHHLQGDELHTRQILINILGNAVKFTPKREKITFKIEEVEGDAERVVIRYTVIDTGIGMSKEFIKHIFEPFAQESVESRTNYTGTGLGMAITKKFVDLLGGTISVTSTLHKGSEFVVEIPYGICENNVEVEETITEIDVKGMKVLLVEDNELNVEIAKLMLEENCVEVVIAQDGQVAVDMFRENDPFTFDAILMDVMMPVMDGLVATRIIRCLKKKDSDTIPIIAMTANAYQEDIRKTKKAGMNEHISKPIDINLLLETLTKYNQRKNNT